MSQHVLNATARPVTNKGAVNAMRREGKIPAVVYNRHGKTTTIALDGTEFRKGTVGVTESTILELKVGNTSMQCMIKDRQLDWLKGQIVHVDFFEVESGVAMRAKVSIHTVGTPVGVREGGIFENPVHEVEVECMPKDMPAKFEIDVSALKVNHSIHVRDIPCPAGVKILSAADQVVALVKYAKAEVEAPAAEEAPVGAAAAAPAAGAAAPAPATPAK